MEVQREKLRTFLTKFKMKLTKADCVDARSTDGREVQIAVERAEQQRGPVRLTTADIGTEGLDVHGPQPETAFGALIDAEHGDAVDARSRENSAINDPVDVIN